MSHVNETVIFEIQERLERDPAAFKRVLQSFGIPKKQSRLISFSSIFQLFPDTPVTMLKDVFEALQLYDLLELLDIKSTKPRSSLQLAYTLDAIKKLNEVADLPTTYHSCGAVFIITDDEDISSAIKTFFTDLDSKSDVTEIVVQDIPTLRHLNEEINAMILEISARFGNLLEGETQRQTEVSRCHLLSRLKNALDRLQLRDRELRSESHWVIGRVMQLSDGLYTVRMELNNIMFRIQLEGETELRQTDDELKSFIHSMIVTVERIRGNLIQLLERGPERFFIEEEKVAEKFQENVSAVINRWIHRQG